MQFQTIIVQILNRFLNNENIPPVLIDGEFVFNS